MPCSNFNLEVLLPLSPTPSSSESPYIYLQICPTSNHFSPSALLSPALLLTICTDRSHCHFSPDPCSCLPYISLLLLLPAFKLFWTQQPEWPCSNQVRCLHSSAQHPDRASLLSHWPPRTTWPAPLAFSAPFSLSPHHSAPDADMLAVPGTLQAPPYLRVFAPAVPSHQTSAWLTPAFPTSQLKWRLFSKATPTLLCNTANIPHWRPVHFAPSSFPTALTIHLPTM